MDNGKRDKVRYILTAIAIITTILLVSLLIEDRPVQLETQIIRDVDYYINLSRSDIGALPAGLAGDIVYMLCREIENLRKGER